MECAIDSAVDYLTVRFVTETQRRAIASKAVNAAQSNATFDPNVVANPADCFVGTSWQPTIVEYTLKGESRPLKECLQSVLDKVVAHADAWPFQEEVSPSIAPDYLNVISDPVDLSLIRSRLERPGGSYYASLDMFLADLIRMCENCRVYNGEDNEYWECANRLEKYIRTSCGEVSVKVRNQRFNPSA